MEKEYKIPNKIYKKMVKREAMEYVVNKLLMLPFGIEKAIKFQSTNIELQIEILEDIYIVYPKLEGKPLHYNLFKKNIIESDQKLELVQK